MSKQNCDRKDMTRHRELKCAITGNKHTDAEGPYFRCNVQHIAISVTFHANLLLPQKNMVCMIAPTPQN